MSGAYTERGVTYPGSVTGATSLTIPNVVVRQGDAILGVGFTLSAGSLLTVTFNGVAGSEIVSLLSSYPRLYSYYWGEFEPLPVGTYSLVITANTVCDIVAIAQTLRNTVGFPWSNSQTTSAGGATSVMMDTQGAQDGYALNWWNDVGAGMSAGANAALVAAQPTGAGPLALFESGQLQANQTNLTPQTVTTTGATKVVGAVWKPVPSLNVLLQETERGAALL